MSFIHLLLENSTSLRTQSVTHTSFTPPKTQNGMDETQLSFELRVSFIHLLSPKTQNGMDETQLSFELECHSYIFYSPKTQLPFEIKVSLIHLLLPENSKWDG